ncbi:MAG: AI-2E family transporter [Rudaea sp.]
MELRQFFFKTLIFIGTLAGLYVLYSVRGTLLLLFGAILFASTIRPVVTFLKSRGVPTIVSALGSYLAFLIAVAVMLVVFVPALLSGVDELLRSQYYIFAVIADLLQRAQSLTADGTGFRLPVPDAATLQQQVTNLQTTAQGNFQTYLVGGFSAVTQTLFLFVMSFYWLTERDRIERVGARMVPINQRERFLSIFNQIETTLGAYVRGQTILCVTVGVLAFVALSVLDIRMALMLAVFAGIAEAIPMLGTIIGAVPAILLALTESPEKAIMVGIAYLVSQQLEAQLLVPKVMERQVGLSPLLVLLALTAGDLLAGILGALVAIPILAALQILLRELVIEPTVEANKFPVVEGGAVLLTDAASVSEDLANQQAEQETGVVTPRAEQAAPTQLQRP